MTPIRSRVVAAFSFLAAAAMGAAGQVPDKSALRAPWSAGEAEGWSLTWGGETRSVPFRGVVNLDGAGMGTGQMLYPAPNVAGLIAGILAHVAVNETAKKLQKDALQAEADKVLADHRPVIDAFGSEELLHRTVARLRSSAPGLRGGNDARWTLALQPQFWMTQDRRALIVDSVVTVRAGDNADPVHQVAVRVVAAPRAAEGIAAWWNDNNGEALKDESAHLLAQAIELSLSEMAGRWSKTAPAQRTVRFAEGGEERIERAQVLDQHCGRAILRTLRGELLAVSLRNNEAPTPSGCVGVRAVMHSDAIQAPATQ